MITWGRNARFAGELAVGDNIKISGRIQSRVYRKKIGEDVEERTAYEVSVSKIEKVENIESADTAEAAAEEETTEE